MLKHLRIPQTQLLPLAILIAIVFCSAGQTELAHYLTAVKGYRKTYFTFFLTHSTFSVLFPAHLLVLRFLHPRVPVRTYYDGLRDVLAEQLSLGRVGSWDQVKRPWARTVGKLTLLVSLPSLCWFSAVPLTTTTDVTSLYSTSTFFTYGFSLLLLQTPLSRLTVASITLAFGGVLVITLADSKGAEDDSDRQRFLGDIIMLAGAIILGLYEVVYKLALPEGHGGVKSVTATPSNYSPLPTHHATPSAVTPSTSPIITPEVSRPASPDFSINTDVPLLSSSPISQRSMSSLATISSRPLPPSLHANFLTTCIGIMTFVTLWIPIPLLHWTGLEQFAFPSGGWDEWSALAGIMACGALYNAGFMLLIGFWGPTVSSVANLLAIGCVALFDALYVGVVPSLSTMAGAGMIGVGFGVLLWEGEDH